MRKKNFWKRVIPRHPCGPLRQRQTPPQDPSIPGLGIRKVCSAPLWTGGEGLSGIFLKTQEEFHAREAEEQPKVMETYVASGMDEMLDYVYDRFEDFQLLLDASYGTRYQDFVEHLVEIETEYTYKYMEATQFVQEGSMITEEFIHIMSRAMFDSMFEVVRHRMDRDTARKYLHMLEKYHYGGWGAIMKLG